MLILPRCKRRYLRFSHRYWVLLSTCVCQAIFGGVASGTFPMLVGILDTFRTTRAQAGLVMSVMYAFLDLAALLSSAFVHKYGPRVSCVIGSILIAAAFIACFFATSVVYLVIAIGVFAGCGLGLLFVSCAPTVCQHFTGRSQVMALTAMTVGSSIGAMAFSYSLGGLIEQFGLRGTCLIIGGCSLNSVIMTFLWTSKPKIKTVDRNVISTIAKTDQSSKNVEPKHVRNTDTYVQGREQNAHTTLRSSSTTQTDGISQTSLKETFRRVFRNKAFVLFAIGNGAQVAAIQNASMYIVDSMRQEQHETLLWLTPVLLNLMALVGRLLCGLVKLIPHCSSLDVALLSALFVIVGPLLIAFVNSVWMKLSAWCIIGLATGICLASVSITTARLVGRDNLAPGIGFVLTISGIMGIVGGPLNGYIRDVTGSYRIVLVVTAVINTIISVLYFVAKMFRLQENGNTASRRNIVVN